ncbi:Trafficking protein particle complex subunit 12, partial [Quaeritorhiza haematococci]
LRIASLLIELKDVVLAIEVLLSVEEAVKKVSALGINASAASSSAGGLDNVDLLSAMGRCYLQLGDVDRAKSSFAKVERIVCELKDNEPTVTEKAVASAVDAAAAAEGTSGSGGGAVGFGTGTGGGGGGGGFFGMDSTNDLLISSPVSPPGGSFSPVSLTALTMNPNLNEPRPRSPLLLTNLSLLHIAEGNFIAAASTLTTLLHHLTTTATSTTTTGTPAPPDPSSSTTTSSESTSLDTCTTVNNLALCQLYMGNVNQACSFLESLAVEQPTRAGVCEVLVGNLCTLYELGESAVERKKRVLSGVVSRCGGDDFGTECLKL